MSDHTSLRHSEQLQLSFLTSQVACLQLPSSNVFKGYGACLPYPQLRFKFSLCPLAAGLGRGLFPPLFPPGIVKRAKALTKQSGS